LPSTVPIAQVTVPALRAHGAVAETTVVPTGTGTLTTTLIASSRALLLTTAV